MNPKEYIEGLRVYEPGRPLEEVARELGFKGVDDIIKVASNENELGPSPLAIKAMQQQAYQMHRYPDGGAFYLKQKLAKHLDLAPDHFLFGCGSNELIVFLCHVFLEQKTNLVMGAEAFAVYFLAAAMFEGSVVRVPMPQHTHDLDAILAAITPHTRLVIVCNPNNPTGTSVSQEEIDQFIEKLPGHVVAVFDEAYYEVMPKELQPDLVKYLHKGQKNLILLRTFSKGYGLAGLRIGYAMAHPDLIKLLNKIRQPFNVNAMAQAAAMAALDDQEHLEHTRETVREGLRFFEDEFSKMNMETIPSTANFIMVKTGNGRALFEALQRKKVIVRPLDPYGLPNHIRITIGYAEQNRQVLQAIKELLS